MRKTCGLDVHKDTVFCAIYNGKKQSEVKEFVTTTPGIYAMAEELQMQNVSEVAIESTGIYWKPVWNILDELGFRMLLVNPYLIKQMPGRKSDVKDAQWIATLLHKGLLRGSLIPCKEIRELRTYSRQYIKLQQKQTSVLQELERTLEMCGIRITSFVSNISAKSVIEVIKKIIANEDSAEALSSSVHKRIINKHSRQKIIESLTGFITPQSRFTLSLALNEYDMLVNQSQQCLSMMEQLCKQHYDIEMELLQTIPGVSKISSMIILAETGGNMKAFENSGKFVGWTGLRPRNDESAGKYKSTATTKGNKYLRTILVQVAWAASRTKGSFFKEKFNRLAIRMPRKKALIAIARKMAVLVWHILDKNQAYDPNKIVIIDPVKLETKVKYHQKEIEKLEKLM
jgi:transposase